MTSITDARLRIAAEKFTDNAIEAIQQKTETEHTFSEDFYKRLEGIFADQSGVSGSRRKVDLEGGPVVTPSKKKRIFNIAKHAAAVLFALVCIFSLTLLISPTARAWTARWIRTVFGNGVIFRILVSGDDRPLSGFAPGWLPEDLKETERQEDTDHIAVTYSNQDGSRYLRIEQRRANEKILETFNNDISSALDTKPIPIGLAYHIDNSLIWHDEYRQSVFSVEGNLKYLEELCSVALWLEFNVPEYEVQWAAERFSEKNNALWAGWTGGCQITYYNGTGGRSDYECLVFKYGFEVGYESYSWEIKNGEFIINKGDAPDIESVRIGKMPAEYVVFKTLNDEQRPPTGFLFWFDGEAGLVFSLTGNPQLTKEELIKAAESIRIISQ